MDMMIIKRLQRFLKSLISTWTNLHNFASSFTSSEFFLLPPLIWIDVNFNSLFENGVQIILRGRAALDVLDRSNVTRQSVAVNGVQVSFTRP